MADVIISRAEAKAQGLTHYFTGKPCKYGHVSKRWTCSCKCIECHVTEPDRLVGPRGEAAAKGLKTYIGTPCEYGHTERYTSNGVCRECQPCFNGNRLSASKIWEEAEATGLEYYFTGRPCKHGHVSKRYVSGGQCYECHMIWLKENKDAVDVSKKKYAEANRELHNEKMRADRVRHPEKYRAYSRRYAKSHQKQIRVRTDAWAKAHPEWRVAKTHKRRARMKGGENYTAKDVKEIYKAQKGKCAYCKKSLRKGYHVDHIVALSRGGSNERKNIQLLCGKCNVTKSNKDPIKFAQELGRLI